MTPLCALLREQAIRQWEQVGEAVTVLDEGTLWRGAGLLVPGRILGHVLDTVDFYLRPAPEEFPFGGRLGFDWEEAQLSAQPSVAAFAAYQQDLGSQLDAWFVTHDDVALLGPNTFPWTGPNPAARLVYLLRHTAQHLGELNALLRQWELPRIGWR